MEHKFGLVNWDDVEFKKNNAARPQRGMDQFIRLNNGDNELRLVTNPFMYMVHKYKADGEKGYGEKVMCSLYHGRCPLCEANNTATARWFVGVIDRKTQSYKILDMSPDVFRQLQKFNRNPKIGDPKNYDINIVVDKNAGPNGYYTVQHYSNEPLSETDVELKKKADLNELKRRCTPPTPEQVEERVKRLQAKVSAAASNATVNNSQTDDSEDDDITFPPANVSQVN